MNGRMGTGHWLELSNGELCICLKDWVWDKLRADKTAPSITERKIAQWNAENPKL